MGLSPETIVVLDNNGIEYYYPSQILSQIFECGMEDICSIDVNDDRIHFQGMVYTKDELCEKVIARLTSDVTYCDEMENRLLKPIAELVF